ncbi:MAG: hypothetical protein KC425_01235 [Anaerolineales bacterium]|nr:hypothetical protein [Anaerolineales bacterium]
MILYLDASALVKRYVAESGSTYAAVHLAAALIWQEEMAQSIVLATYDRQLWTAATQSGVTPFPDALAHPS